MAIAHRGLLYGCLTENLYPKQLVLPHETSVVWLYPVVAVDGFESSSVVVGDGYVPLAARVNEYV